MAKDKDKTLNPATASLKASKASAIKKQKAAIAAQRSQRLATRNPTHLSNQIRTLKEEQEAKGRLAPQQQKRLETLEREFEGVKKAREKFGTDRERDGAKAESRGEKRKFQGSRDGRAQRDRKSNPNLAGLGKDRGRRWGEHGADDSASEDTDPEVRSIPMPRDTPPPTPPKPSRSRPNMRDAGTPDLNSRPSVRPSDEPLPPLNRATQPHPLPQRPPAAAPQPTKAVYESKPVLRDLRKEATKAFVPAAVARRRAEAEKEKERLKEPEEVEIEEERTVERSRGSANGQASAEDEEEEEFGRFLGEVDVDMDQPHNSGEGEEASGNEEACNHAMDSATAGTLADALASAAGTDKQVGGTASRSIPRKMALVEDYASDDE